MRAVRPTRLSGDATFPALLGAALGHLLVVLVDLFVGLVAVGGLLLYRSRLTTGVGVVFRLPTLLFSRLRAGAGALSVVHRSHHLSSVVAPLVPLRSPEASGMSYPGS